MKKQSIVHISNKNETILFPDINNEKILEVVSYVSGQDIAFLKKNQKIRFELNNRDSGTSVITGKIQSISVYPEANKGQSEYEVISKIQPTKKEKNSLRYGMQG